MNRLIRSHLAFAAVAAVLALPASAQEVSVGVKGGLNIADLSVEEEGASVDTDARTGLIGGAFLEVGLGRFLAVQPEVLYSQKGAKAEEEGIEGRVEVDYVEMPLLLVLRLPVETSPVRPRIFAGPAISFETRCNLEVEDLGGECDDEGRKKTDVGAVFGAGVVLAAGDRAFVTAEGRYNLGLTNLDEEEGSSAKNRVLSFLVGVGVRVR